VSPERRRATLDRVRCGLGHPRISERRLCCVLDQPRSTQRYPRKVKTDQRVIVARMHVLVRRWPRFGYRRIHAMLRREGFRINRKRVYRLWKREGFKVPQKQRKKRRLGTSGGGIMRCRAASINDVWCWDFIYDRDEQGRVLRWLIIEDELTREGLALEVERSMKAVDVLDVLTELMLVRGVPRHIRSDNGPEFIAAAIRRFLDQAGVATLYIEAGAPWQNGYAESFGGRFRDELLNAELFADLREAKILSNMWRNDYNHRRPHSSLRYQTPAEFAATLRPAPVGATPLASPASAQENHTPTLITPGT